MWRQQAPSNAYIHQDNYNLRLRPSQLLATEDWDLRLGLFKTSNQWPPHHAYHMILLKDPTWTGVFLGRLAGLDGHLSPDSRHPLQKYLVPSEWRGYRQATVGITDSCIGRLTPKIWPLTRRRVFLAWRRALSRPIHGAAALQSAARTGRGDTPAALNTATRTPSRARSRRILHSISHTRSILKYSIKKHSHCDQRWPSLVVDCRSENAPVLACAQTLDILLLARVKLDSICMRLCVWYSYYNFRLWWSLTSSTGQRRRSHRIIGGT